MNNIRSVGVHTKICAVIGNPIEHSLSPAIHNAAYEALSLDFVYVACKVLDVKNALAGVRALGNFRGLSVTIPHKIEVMTYVDDIDPTDRLIGSINTVICEKDKLLGLGTDGPGALKAFVDSNVTLDGKNVLILGSGGVARAIAFTLAHKADLAELTLLDINIDLLESLKADLKDNTKIPIKSAVFTSGSLSNAMQKAEIIIHCTSVGMYPHKDDSLIPANLFNPGQVVFDAVYTPLETRLIADAKACGLQIISGVEMFLNQAALQFEKFTGKEAPIAVMRKVAMKNLRH
jgi:shikimate dehydrogenase